MGPRLASLLVSLALGTACARPAPEIAPPPAPEPIGIAMAADTIEAQALLLLMSDRRQFDPFSVDVVRSGHPELWPDLALALARIGDPRGRPVLESLMLDSRPEVRRRAVFALGILGERAAIPALLAAVFDRDRATGRGAVAALARLETPLVRVVEAAVELPPEERWERLLPELFRFEPEEVLVLAEEALAAAPPAGQAWALYALGRKAIPAGREALRAGLAHPDPWARGWAARGLGGVGEASDLGRLEPLLADAAQGPVVRALGAAARLIGDGKSAAPADWIPTLLRLLDDRRTGVRLTALQVASHWLLEPRLGARLATRAREGTQHERGLALVALAAAGDSRVDELLASSAAAPEVSLRVAAATAAGRAGADDVLSRLAGDAAPAVRLAVLAARLESAGVAAGTDARRALIDPDPAVRAAGLEWLVANPVAPMEEIAIAIHGADSRRLVELRLDGVGALTARAVAESLERGAIVALLEVLARDDDYLVRRAAADALAELDRPRPTPEPVTTSLGLAGYREIARTLQDAPRVTLETAAGELTLELDCRAAPMTCRSFLQLVGQGFYDGVVFHRVVPDFVVQAGDPRGDGWGGPGYTLRDEFNLLRYERGVLGMARSAADTAGSQFFLTISPQPHLDGAYTAFGRVVAGEGTLDAIVQGDRILRMTEAGADG